jgi:hypothetical protein
MLTVWPVVLRKASELAEQIDAFDFPQTKVTANQLASPTSVIVPSDHIRDAWEGPIECLTLRY